MNIFYIIIMSSSKSTHMQRHNNNITITPNVYIDSLTITPSGTNISGMRRLTTQEMGENKRQQEYETRQREFEAEQTRARREYEAKQMQFEAEVRKQEAEARKQEAEARKQEAEVRKQEAEVRKREARQRNNTHNTSTTQKVSQQEIERRRAIAAKNGLYIENDNVPEIVVCPKITTYTTTVTINGKTVTYQSDSDKVPDIQDLLKFYSKN